MGQIHHTIAIPTSTNVKSQKEWRPRDTLFTAFAIRARRMSVLHFWSVTRRASERASEQCRQPTNTKWLSFMTPGYFTSLLGSGAVKYHNQMKETKNTLNVSFHIHMIPNDTLSNKLIKNTQVLRLRNPLLAHLSSPVLACSRSWWFTWNVSKIVVHSLAACAAFCLESNIGGETSIFGNFSYWWPE